MAAARISVGAGCKRRPKVHMDHREADPREVRLTKRSSTL